MLNNSNDEKIVVNKISSDMNILRGYTTLTVIHIWNNLCKI